MNTKPFIYYDRNKINGITTVTARIGSEVIYKQKFVGYKLSEIKTIVKKEMKDDPHKTR